MIQIKCPSCAKYCEYPNSFCTWCGTPLPKIKICHNCGHEIEEENNFCTYCGQSKENFQAQDDETIYNTNIDVERISNNLETTRVGSADVNSDSNGSVYKSPPHDTLAKVESEDNNGSLWNLRKGRISKRAYIKFCLYGFLACLLIIIVSMAITYAIGGSGRGVIKGIVFSVIGFVIGMFINMSRRMHDINYSSWYIVGYYCLVPLLLSSIGVDGAKSILASLIIPMVILAFIPSYPKRNKWGDPPVEE